MSSALAVDLFVEDRAHEEFLLPMLLRVAREESVTVESRVRSARGGHGRVLEELRLYEDAASKGVARMMIPDLLIAGIDGNCTPSARAKKEIEKVNQPSFVGRLVTACPDPHIERWYLADPESFKAVVGRQPRIGPRKCKRDYYKGVLANAVRQAGHPSTLGGLEFAREIVEAMDLYRAGKNDRSLKAFVDSLRAALRTSGASRALGG